MTSDPRTIEDRKGTSRRSQRHFQADFKGKWRWARGAGPNRHSHSSPLYLSLAIPTPQPHQFCQPLRHVIAQVRKVG